MCLPRQALRCPHRWSAAMPPITCFYLCLKKSQIALLQDTFCTAQRSSVTVEQSSRTWNDRHEQGRSISQAYLFRTFSVCRGRGCQSPRHTFSEVRALVFLPHKTHCRVHFSMEGFVVETPALVVWRPAFDANRLRVWALGFRFQVSSFRFQVLGFRVSGLEFRA
jgi:hypothetical protein